ncbi:MAG: CvpA family protein [Burkholderiaceae bacterium]|jgi:membrane protein required for colicin V production
MTSFDYLVIGIIVLSVLLSLMRGLVVEVLSLVKWTVALYVANHFGAALSLKIPIAEGLSPPLQLLAGCVAAFVLTMLVGSILTFLIGSLIKSAGLNFADRWLGAIFGLGRGIVMVLSLVIAGGLTSLPEKDFWRHARLAPYAENAVRALKPHLPGTMTQWIRY